MELYLEPVRAVDLLKFASRNDQGPSFLHEMVRRLIEADSGAVVSGFSPREGLRERGWDGQTYHESGTQFIPKGHAHWELTTQASGISQKVDSDFRRRTANPLGAVPSNSVYVAVVLGRWAAKLQWLASRKQSGWQDVRVFDVDDLVSWLNRHIDVLEWTTRLIRGIQIGMPITRSHGGLPLTPATYIEREDLTEEILGHARVPGGPRIVAIWGSPGIGKTALGIAAANTLAPEFPDGQFFAAMHSQSGQSMGIEDVLKQVIEGLDGSLPPKPVEGGEVSGRLITKFRNATRNRKVLIVLDDVINEDDVRSAVPADEGSLVIVTSRRRLSGLDGARHVEVLSLTPAQSEELFTRFAELKVAPELEEIERLVTICAGVPLALKIAGALVSTHPAWGLGSLLADLVDEKNRLTVLAAGDQAVRASFMVSYRRLSEQQQRAFRSIGLIPGHTFTAELVSKALETGRFEASQLLRSLSESALIEPSAEKNTYTLHDLLHIFSVEMALKVEGEQTAMKAQLRIVNWLLEANARLTGRLVETLTQSTGSRGPEGLDALRWFDRYSDNVVAAVPLVGSAFGQPETALFAIDFIAVYLCKTERWNDLDWVSRLGLDYLKLIRSEGSVDVQIEEFHRTNDVIEAALLLRRAQCAIGLENAPQAFSFAQASLDVVERLGGFEYKSVLWTILGHAHCMQGAWARGLACYENAAEIASSRGDTNEINVASYNVGRALHHLGRHEEGLAFLEAELATVQSSGDRKGEGISLNMLGNSLARVGRVEEAEEKLETAISAFKDAQDRENEAHAIFDLATVKMQKGDLAIARKLFMQELTIIKGFRDEVGQAKTIIHLLQLDLEERLVTDKDLKLVTRCLDTIGAHDSWFAQGLIVRAKILTHLNRHEECDADIREALLILNSLDGARIEIDGILKDRNETT